MHAIVLIGRVRAGLDPQLLLQTALCLLQAGRARTWDRLGFLGAFLIQLAFGLAQPSATALAGLKVLRQLIAALIPIELILGGVDFSGLFEDLPCDLIEVGVLLAARVRVDLRAVDGDRADLDHPGPRAQAEHAAEQPGERIGVLGAKAVDRHVIGREVRRDHAVGDVLHARALDTSRGALSLAIGVENDRHHHRRVIRCTTPAVLAIARVEGREVDVLDRIDHEPREVVLRQPLAQRGRHQQQLLTITFDEVLGHPRSVLTTPDRPGFAKQPRVEAGVSPHLGLARASDDLGVSALRAPTRLLSPGVASVSRACAGTTAARPYELSERCALTRSLCNAKQRRWAGRILRSCPRSPRPPTWWNA